MTPEQILEEKTSESGNDRESYLVDKEEFITLMDEGSAILKKLDISNGDGTFSSSLVFKNKTFLYVSNVRITPGGVN